MLFCPPDRTVGNKAVRKAAEPGLPDTGMQIRSRENMDTHKTKNKAIPCAEVWKHSWSRSSRVKCRRTLLRGGLGAFVSHASLLSYSHWLRESLHLRKTSGIVSPQDFSSQTSGFMTCLTMESSRISKVACVRLQVFEIQLLCFNEQNLFLKLM